MANNEILHLRGKRLTGIKPPGDFVVTPRTLMFAAGDKQRTARTGAVDDIHRVVLVIIHCRLAQLTGRKMLNAPFDFLLLTGIEGARIRAAQIAADPPGYDCRILDR